MFGLSNEIKRSHPATIVLSLDAVCGRERFRLSWGLPITPLAIVLQITRRPEPDDPRVPARQAYSEFSAINPPKPKTVAVSHAVDTLSRIEQLTQVFPPPPIGPEPVFLEPVQVDQADSWTFSGP